MARIRGALRSTRRLPAGARLNLLACAGAAQRHRAAVAVIENDPRLQQAIEQIERLYQGLDARRGEVLPKNPRNFTILAEGPLDEIRKTGRWIERP